MPISKIPVGAIQSGTIGTSQIADNAVTTAKILNDNVTSAKIPNDAVGSTEIASDAVTGDKIGTDTIKTVNADSIMLNSTNGTADAGDFLVLDGTDNSSSNANDRILYDETFNPATFNIGTGTAGQAIKVATNGGLEFGTAGGILQVVQTVKTDNFSTSSTTFVDVTGLSVAITPSSTSSKVLIMINMNSSTSGGNNGMIKLVRGSTDIAVGDASGSRLQATAQTRMDNDSNSCATLTTCFLDSPNTTSATTYKVQYEVQGGTGTINITQGGADNAGFGNIISTITAMEVSA